MLLLDETRFDRALEFAATELDRRVFERPHTLSAGEIRAVFETLLMGAVVSSTATPDGHRGTPRRFGTRHPPAAEDVDGQRHGREEQREGDDVA